MAQLIMLSRNSTSADHAGYSEGFVRVKGSVALWTSRVMDSHAAVPHLS